MQSEGDSLWESFPQALESQEGARRYINAFRAPFQELPSLSLQQEYTLRVCSLLVIPPPIGRMVPQGGFPSDLSKLNLLRWADLIQDVAVGLRVLPPRLHLNLGSPVVALLQLLEVATGVGFCHHCCHPGPHCTCTGALQSAPSTSWSQVVQQTPGYGVTSTSGGATYMSTPMGGIPGYVAPPQGRASILTLHQQAQVPRAMAPRAPTPSAPKLQAPPTRAPQTMPPLCQSLPSSGSRPATPYQQVVQPPVKLKGRGVTFDTPADKVAAVGGQDTDSRGRQKTHNRDNKARPTSPGRGACERSSIRTTDKQMPHQAPSGAARDAPRFNPREHLSATQQ